MNSAAFGMLTVTPWAAAPFALLLAAVAVMPLLAPHWWHVSHAQTALGENRHKALVAALLALPTAAYLLTLPGGAAALGHEVEGYVSFIVLLTALYAIAGGVHLHDTLPATPLVNVGFLLAGAVLANVIGTTGASMLLIRPFLRGNHRRVRRVHLPVFFIFVVSNTGGLLTPMGDPPLFLGFLNGVPFTWTLGLWPQWLLVNGLVLLAFVAVDAYQGRREKPEAIRPHPGLARGVKVEGLGLNGPLMAGVAAAVLAKAVLPFPLAEGVMAGCALASVLFTPKAVRHANQFAWGPMAEVAVLFAGIFVTMVPALALLDANGAALGLGRPWEFFWITGVLSSVLDNAPTYLTIGTLAANGQGLAALAATRPDLLAAVSCGAVFMGANSYVGNGPNFMVKAIAEANGYPMPSFFGYVVWAAVVLGPVLVLATAVFFRG